MNLEKPFLIIIFTLFLSIGVSNMFNDRIQHDFPWGYYASDTFQQQTRAEGIKEAGNYRNEPFFIVKGYQDVIGYYPPVIHHLGILLHYATGIPLHDTVYFMVFFLAILAIFVMYITIRKYNKQVAILSIPLALLIFSGKSYIGYTWGHWASITGQMFLVCLFWAVANINIEKSEILLAIFIAALALAHNSELIFGVFFIFIYAIILLIFKKLDLKFIKKIIVAGAISFVLSIYYLYIFSKSFLVINPYNYSVSLNWGGTPIFQLIDFGILAVFLIIGLIASFLFFKKFDVPMIAGIFMLGIGYTNYVGFGIRAFQPRIFWPIYFCFFFGLGLYMILKFIPSSLRTISSFALIAIILILMIIPNQIPTVPKYGDPSRGGQISTRGIMDEPHWQMFRWISENTPKDSKIYFFYGDAYNQDAILRNSQRMHVQVVPEDFTQSLNNRTITRNNEVEIPADHGAGMPYVKSFLNIGLHQRDDLDNWLWSNKADVCDFDYFVFDLANYYKELSEYNQIIMQNIIEKGSEIVYPLTNEDFKGIIVVKNNKVGDDCLEETNF